jgi:hypothetical protein
MKKPNPFAKKDEKGKPVKPGKGKTPATKMPMKKC